MKEKVKSQAVKIIEEQTDKRFLNKQEAEQLKMAELKARIRLETEEMLKRNRLRGLFEI